MKSVQKTIFFLSIFMLLVVLMTCGMSRAQMQKKEREDGKVMFDEEGKRGEEGESHADYVANETGRISAAAEQALERTNLMEKLVEERKVKLVFSGDIYLKDDYLEAYDAYGINGIVSQDVLNIMTRADIMIANQEFAFSQRGVREPDKQFTFRVPPERVNIFQELGIDVVSLANNHAMDFGRIALSDTFEALDKAGILYIGAGENIERAKKMETVEVKGKTIGFLAASRVIPVVDWNAGVNTSGMLTTYSPEMLLQAIQENRENCDILVVYVHWGVERNTYPEEYQFTMAKQYIDAGADIVIGSHPHVLQGIEYYKGKPILYSMGNYMFSSNTEQSMLAEITISSNGDMKMTLIPVSPSQTPLERITGEKEQEFYRYMEELSFGVTIGETGEVRDNAG